MKQKENIEKAKIIMVSDIKGSGPSILPYALRLAKHLESDLEIVHVVDSRNQHGVPSRYADSQSLTPGPKLSHEKIILRELEQAKKLIDEKLSSEASRINYPLNIKTKVKRGNLNDELSESIPHEAKHILLINSEADNYIFHSRSEMIELAKQVNAVALLVPPETKFEAFKEIALITDFSNKFGLSSYSQKLTFLKKFHPEIMAIDVAKPKRFFEKELKSRKWRNAFERSTLQNIKTRVLKGKNHSDALLQYIGMVKPQLIIYSYRKPGFFNRLFHKPFFINIVNKANYPILYLV